MSQNPLKIQYNQSDLLCLKFTLPKIFTPKRIFENNLQSYISFNVILSDESNLPFFTNSTIFPKFIH